MNKRPVRMARAVGMMMKTNILQQNNVRGSFTPLFLPTLHNSVRHLLLFTTNTHGQEVTESQTKLELSPTHTHGPEPLPGGWHSVCGRIRDPGTSKESRQGTQRSVCPPYSPLPFQPPSAPTSPDFLQRLQETHLSLRKTLLTSPCRVFMLRFLNLSYPVATPRPHCLPFPGAPLPPLQWVLGAPRESLPEHSPQPES